MVERTPCWFSVAGHASVLMISRISSLATTAEEAYHVRSKCTAVGCVFLGSCFSLILFGCVAPDPPAWGVGSTSSEAGVETTGSDS